MGDSVVAVNAGGFDQGFNLAASNTFGLAGTGLYGGTSGSLGFGFNNYGGLPNADTSIGAVPSAQQGYVLPLGSVPLTAGSTPVTGYAWGLHGTTSSPSAAYDWHIYTASPAGGGSIGAFRRIGVGDANYYYNVLQNAGPTVTNPAASGLQETVFNFAAQPTPAEPSVNQEFWLSGVTNTSIVYSRLLQPGATGVTVSTVGYGGHDTRQLYQDFYQQMSPAGRVTYLESLIEGGSGRLNVVLEEGFNDRNDTTTSVNGVAPSNTAAGFKDNLTTLIGAIRSDWSSAGLPAGKLSFTLLGMYRDYYETAVTPDTGPIYQYNQVEMGLAKGDPLISYVDLYDNQPDYNTANADGYMLDTTHPSLLGSEVYTQYAMDQIAVPEPAGITVLTVASILLLWRRERA